jgi:YjbE family integral membrane protein
MDASQFLTALGIIIMIDLILGGDNAVVIALASRNLPAEQRNKAILYGTGLAILVRVSFTLVAVWLLSIPYLLLIGGLLLMWIAIRLLNDKNEEAHIKSEYTLLAAIKTIVIADVVMGVDNVLAIAGAAHGNMWLVTLGLLISIPIIVWGSKLILMLFDRYPSIIYIGAAILAYTAGSMITHEPMLQAFIKNETYLKWLVPIIAISTVLMVGYIKNTKIIQPTRKEYDTNRN